MATIVLILLAPTVAGGGTFPGSNGVIAFTSGSTIVVVAPDGSGLTPIVSGQSPSWNADGTRIAFVRSGALFLMDPDGTNAGGVPGAAASDDLGLSWAVARAPVPPEPPAPPVTPPVVVTPTFAG